METVYGESPEIKLEDSYNASNGIATFSANDNNTQTGGSIYNPDGSYFEGYQILWTVTRVQQSDGSYQYEGGVTAQEWYTEYPDSPFYLKKVQDIGDDAFRDNNLNKYFTEWLSNTTSDEKWTFITTRAGKECVHFNSF